LGVAAALFRAPLTETAFLPLRTDDFGVTVERVLFILVIRLLIFSPSLLNASACLLPSKPAVHEPIKPVVYR